MLSSRGADLYFWKEYWTIRNTWLLYRSPCKCYRAVLLDTHFQKGRTRSSMTDREYSFLMIKQREELWLRVRPIWRKIGIGEFGIKSLWAFLKNEFLSELLFQRESLWKILFYCTRDHDSEIINVSWWKEKLPTSIFSFNSLFVTLSQSYRLSWKSSINLLFLVNKSINQ